MVTLCVFIFFSSWPRGANQSHASLENFGASCASASLAAWTCWWSGSFQSCPCTVAEEPGLPLALCNTKPPSSRMAWPWQCSFPAWVRPVSWCREAGGDCTPAYSAPHLCPSVQPAKKKVSFQPDSNTCCPPSAVSSAAAGNRDMSLNTHHTKNCFEAFLLEVNSLGYIRSAEKKQTVQESSHSHASSWTMEQDLDRPSKIKPYLGIFLRLPLAHC